jgi:hypothetical protein
MRNVVGLALVLVACRHQGGAHEPIVVDALPTSAILRGTCVLALDLPREPTTSEITQLAMCGGRTIARATVEPLTVAPPRVALPAPPAELRAWRVRSGEATVTVLARSARDEVRVLAVSDTLQGELPPMALVRIGDHEITVRERRDLPSFRGHTRDVLAIAPQGAELDAAAEGSEMLVGVRFCAECQGDGWRPPWIGSLTVARVEADGTTLLVRETWSFTSTRTGERSAFRLERVYAYRYDAVVESPSFDEIARWREVRAGLARPPERREVTREDVDGPPLRLVPLDMP